MKWRKGAKGESATHSHSDPCRPHYRGRGPPLEVAPEYLSVREAGDCNYLVPCVFLGIRYNLPMYM